MFGLFLVLLTALCIPSCRARSSGESSAKDRVKLDVCTSSVTATQLPLAYATQRGLFAKYGLDVSITSMDSGSRAVAALVSSSASVCQISGSAVVNAIAAGADLAIVGAVIGTNPYSLMVSPAIRSSEDLKGKVVAVSDAGSSSAISMRMALRILGLDPDRDVTLLSLGAQSERRASLEAGYVVGTIADPPESIFARKNGYHALLDLSAMNRPYLQTGTVTTKAFIGTHRTALLNYMKAISEAVYLLKRDKEDAIRELSKHLELDSQKESDTLEETYDVLVKRIFTYPPVPSLQGIQLLIDEIAIQNPEAKRLRPEDVADLTIVKELEGTGFFRSLAERK
jgi:NitT/TauT family transport system substrate-binding protein